ncbi:MAG: DUF6144 family protein [Candidatus Bathyarchaeota archaeon]|nr:DUF6144 family protein [Candidatus Bathyarchaeota archaeon]
MTQKHLEMIKEIKENIRTICGETTANKVMEDAEKLKASTNKVKLAEWVQSAMERLDTVASKNESKNIMGACGRNCAQINHKAIEAFKKRRAKYNSLTDFLQAESQLPMKGTKLFLEEDFAVQVYCPSEFGHPMRCYCSLVNGLPADKTMSLTYCQCSCAFVKQMWEETLGQQVSVTLLKTALSGANECHFRIDFKSSN